MPTFPAAHLRVRDAFIGFFQRFPWFGWAVWIAVCTILVVQSTPKRFGATFEVYIAYAHRFWTQQPIYDFSTLGAFLYWPISLLILRPFLAFDLVTAAMLALALSAALLSYAAFRLMDSLLGERIGTRHAAMLAGILLLINLPAAWFNFKQIQAQVAMTAGMMLAAAAMMRGRSLAATLWLFFSAVVKPLSIVMILLCAAVQPRLRLPLIAALVCALALPFLFVDAGYLIGQYRAWIEKLGQLSAARPAEWPYQADFASMLDAFGLTLPSTIATIIRLLAALGTLALAWRVARADDRRIFALAVLLLSACYINLFGPRNEFLSFLVLTPALTALALLLLVRDPNDRRGWLLIAASLALGMVWHLSVDRVLKPAIVAAIYGWLIWLTLDLRRWREVLEGNPAAPASR